MCFLCQNSRTEEEYQNRRKEAIQANSHTTKANSIIDELKISLKNEKLQFSKIIDQKDWELEDLHKEIQKLNEENASLKQKCTERPTEYIKQLIEIQCPYCDHMETIESPGTEPIRVSEILADHLSEKHVPPSLIATKAVQPRCGSCLVNFENMERVRQDLKEKKDALRAAVTTYEWIFMGEDENDIAYVGCTDGDTTIGLVRVKRIHLNEIPDRMEKGQCIFADGTSYPQDLIKMLKSTERRGNKKLSPPKIGSREVTHTSLAVDSLDKKHESLPLMVSAAPLSASELTDLEGLDAASSYNQAADIEEVVNPSPAAEEKQELNISDSDQKVTEPLIAADELNLKPDENKILNFIRDHPECHQANIADDLEINSGTVSRHIKSLKEKKLLSVSDGGELHAI